MEKWKNIGKKLLFPPVWLIAILTGLSATLIALIFIRNREETPLAYVVYVVAFYSLTILSAYLTVVLPKQYKQIRKKIYAHPLGNRYMTDTAFKVQISLFVSLAINLVYSAFHLFSGIFYASFWIGAIAVYYVLLSVIRFFLLYHIGKKRSAGLIEEYRSYRTAAILMMCINLTLSGIVLNMILGKQTPQISDVFVITSAVYTFYILTVSIIDIVRYHNDKSPLMSASKAIRLAAALVSLLSLETSMLVQFGEDENFRRLMTAMTGAGVCIIVLTMSVYMIVKANRAIKKIQFQEEIK